MNDLKATTLKLPANEVLPCMLWADAEGTAFLALEGDTGVLRRISFPDCIATKEKQLDGAFTWMSLSAEGLLLSDPHSEKIWIVDPATLEVKDKIPVPKLKRATSSPGLSWAAACDQGSFQSQKLYVVDLKSKASARVTVPQGAIFFGPHLGQFSGNRIGVDNPVVTPDGRHVFTQGDNPIVYPGPGPLSGSPVVPPGVLPSAISRFSFNDGKLKYEESDAGRTEQEPKTDAVITVSPDSKLVCLVSSQSGVVKANHGYMTPIYPLDTFKKPSATLVHGNAIGGVRPQAVGFDLKANCIYAPDLSHELIIWSPKGERKMMYTFETRIQSWPEVRNWFGVVIQEAVTRPWQEGDPAGFVQQYLVYPGGHQLIMMTNEAIYAVEIPKDQ